MYIKVNRGNPYMSHKIGIFLRQIWLETNIFSINLKKVSAAVESFRGSQRARQLLEKLTDFPNVPRKKAKFFNFMFNSFRSYGVNEAQLDEIWSVIEEFDKQSKQDAAKAAVANSNANQKRKHAEEEESESNKKTKLAEEPEEIAFDWATLIKTECCKHPNNEIILKKLEKKVWLFGNTKNNTRNQNLNSFVFFCFVVLDV